MKKSSFHFIAAILCMFSLQASFAQSNCQSMGTTTLTPKVVKAVCVLVATQGNSVTGTVQFTLTDKGVKVIGDIQGLSKGKHGFHIHECGDCSAVDGTSAGGHFNPDTKQHGSPDAQMRHAGDLGNLEADETGKAHIEYIDPTIMLEGDASIIGRAIIVHKNEDDLKTQPTGNAGPRIACGVIGIGK